MLAHWQKLQSVKMCSVDAKDKLALGGVRRYDV